jgi:hypothetical protein
VKQYRLADASKAKVDASTYIEDVLFVDGHDRPVNVTGGSTATPYVLPAAAENALGGVKLANVPISGTANASVAVAASTAPTKAEYDALVGAYNDLAQRVNALVAGLVAAGSVKTS